MLILCSHPSQADVDADGVGDVCVGDTDSDSVFDYQVSLTLIFRLVQNCLSNIDILGLCHIFLTQEHVAMQNAYAMLQ